MKFLKMMCVATLVCGGLVLSGCMTHTRYVLAGQRVQAVAAFSQDDMDWAVNEVLQSLYLQGCLIPTNGVRKVVVVENVRNDTLSRGSEADALAEMFGISLRERLTASGRVIVFNKDAARFATVRVDPQFSLLGRLTQRNLRQDNGDIQIEYSLNLQLIDLATGLEFWQKRTPLRKIADPRNVL